MERGFARDTTLSVKDFLVAKEVVYITEYTTVMRCTTSLSVSAELRSRGAVLLDKPNTIEAIKASPLKTRVSMKGKIVKVKPVQTVTIRSSGKEKELLTARIKDETGIIPMSLWGKTATKLSQLKVGDCLKIEQGERGVFDNKPTLNTWEDSTTIEMIPDDYEVTSSDEERDQQPFPVAGATHGEWHSIGNVETYEACQNSRCFLKKLNDKLCPTCLTDYSSQKTSKQAWIATAGIKLQATSTVKTCRMFTNVLKQVYSQLRPGVSLPTDPVAIEDELFSFLPKQCSFKINANNVMTDINIL